MKRTNNQKVKKTDNQRNYIILFLIIVLIIITYSTYFSFKNKVIEKSELEIKFNITNKIGFDLNNTLLNFGNVVLDSSSTRNVQIKNNHAFDIKVNVLISDDIERFIAVEKTVYIKKNESKDVEFSLYVNKIQDFGSYSGKAVFYILRA